MSCTHPLQAYRNSRGDVVFQKPDGFSSPLTLSCGQCIACRLRKSAQWAGRCVNEAQMHKTSCFITLTYAPEHLPNPPSLQLDDFQRFMKRLRKRVGKLRFFHCGEYGDRFGRPHYHAIIFGYDFPDKHHWSTSNGQKLYRSKILEELWPFGHSSIGSVTFESAAYVARYALKKITGNASKVHYASCPVTGEVYERKPEYTTMSRRPGIGKSWYDKFSTDVFPIDQWRLPGKPPMQPPKFYDSQFELLYPDDFAMLKSKRVSKAKERAKDKSAPSLDSQRLFNEAILKMLPRNVD